MTPFSEYISISSNSNEIYNEMNKFLSDEKLRNNNVQKAYDWVKDKTWDNLINVYLKLWKLN